MTRKELYSEIYQLNLQSEIKQTTGKNFTQVSNSILEDIVKLAKMATEEALKPKTGTIVYHNGLTELVKLLEKKHILLPSEVKMILG